MVAVILKGNPYEFTPEGESRKLVGVTLHCLLKNKSGFDYAKFSAPAEVEGELKNGVPGRYELETEHAVQGNKTVVKVVGIDFIEHVNLDALFDDRKPAAGVPKS